MKAGNNGSGRYQARFFLAVAHLLLLPLPEERVVVIGLKKSSGISK
jgi:hypothetical protein